MTYFCGTTFIKPDDTQHLPTHMFYDKEVFHVPVDDIHRMCDIERKCFVLPIREYMRCKYDKPYSSSYTFSVVIQNTNSSFQNTNSSFQNTNSSFQIL